MFVDNVVLENSKFTVLFIMKMESSDSAKIRGTVGQAGIGSKAWNRQILRSGNNMFAMMAPRTVLCLIFRTVMMKRMI